MKRLNSGDTMRTVEDGDDCRSLVCDQTGVIIAECVYRCMVCAKVSDTIRDAKLHYRSNHIDIDADDDDDEQFEFNAVEISDDLFACNDFENTSIQGKRKSSFSSHSQQCSKTRVTSAAVSSERESGFFEKLASKIKREDDFQKQLTNQENEESGHVERNCSPPPLNVSLPRGATTGAVGKSGYISCAVCGVIRYYSCIYRRYGQFTCQVCYRFFRTFFLKPKQYFCRTLGKCHLNVRNRCRACWIKSCIGLYAVDGPRQEILEQFQPQKGDIDTQLNLSQFSGISPISHDNGTNLMSKWTISTPSSITITSKVSQTSTNLHSLKSNSKSITL